MAAGLAATLAAGLALAAAVMQAATGGKRMPWEQAAGSALLAGQVLVAATQLLHMELMVADMDFRLGARPTMHVRSSAQRPFRALAWLQVKVCCRARRGVVGMYAWEVTSRAATRNRASVNLAIVW